MLIWCQRDITWPIWHEKEAPLIYDISFQSANTEWFKTVLSENTECETILYVHLSRQYGKHCKKLDLQEELIIIDFLCVVITDKAKKF